MTNLQDDYRTAITVSASRACLSFDQNSRILPVQAICDGRGGRGWKLYNTKTGTIGPDVTDVINRNDKLILAVRKFLEEV